MWKLKEYRGKFCAVARIKGRTIRRSSGTANWNEAERWFDDFIRIQNAPNKFMGEIFQAYKEETSPAEQVKLEHMWKNLEPHFKNFRVDQLDRSKAFTYSKFRQAEGASNNTIIRELGSIRSAARWFDKSYPSTWYMPPKPEPRDRYLTKDEFEKLLECAKMNHVKLFILLALTTGARTTALLELKWPQIDFKRGMVNLGRGTANKKRATLPLNERALKALEEAFRMRTCDYVIQYADGPVKSIRKGFENARDKAKLGKDVTPHTLRHTAACWMAMAGISMDEIAKYLGHTNPQITYSTYAKYSPDYLRKAASVLQ